MRPLLCSWQAVPPVARSRFLAAHGTQNQFGAQLDARGRTHRATVRFPLAAHAILIGSIDFFFRKAAFDLETSIQTGQFKN
jgi:hypothetical protein